VIVNMHGKTTIKILRRVSVHHTCHHQGVFVVVMATLSNDPLYGKWGVQQHILELIT
jgi:hypothetical protein